MSPIDLLRRALPRRLIVLAIGLTTVAVLIGWAAVTAWREADDLRQRFSARQLESFRSADRVESAVLRLQSALLAYEAKGRTTKDLEEFQTESRELNSWLDMQKQMLASPEEKYLLASIDAELDAYLTAAFSFARESPSDIRSLADRMLQTDQAAQRLFSLSAELERAHRFALGASLDAGERSLARLQLVIFTALLVLIGLGAWAVSIIYREMIAPLRAHLVESRALLVRQEKLASLGVLAAGVAHEIRNPLTAIKARLFTQQRALAKETRAFADSEFIAKEISRLERIVRDFLAFARPGDPERARFAATELLHDVVELLSPELRTNNITLAIESGVDVMLDADAAQLKQVLINLVRNAAESINHEGRITMRCKRRRVTLSGHHVEAAILEVEDTGSGIPADVQERLFDPFFTTKSNGTGLGLSIAMRILEKHGGTLRFQTEPGRGATFGLIMPIHGGNGS